MIARPPTPTLFPYTTLFRSRHEPREHHARLASSSLRGGLVAKPDHEMGRWREGPGLGELRQRARRGPPFLADRKSTRLNSSHVEISYAVFCLKKKIRKEWTV